MPDPTLRGPFYALLATSLAWLALHPAPPPPALRGGALHPLALTLACPAPGVAVELRGRGLSCLPPARAARAGLRPGDVIPVDDAGQRCAGPPARLLPERWLAARVPLALNQATLDELTALPELGPALAARIIEHRPLRDARDLAQIPGIGARRATRLLPFLQGADVP